MERPRTLPSSLGGRLERQTLAVLVEIGTPIVVLAPADLPDYLGGVFHA